MADPVADLLDAERRQQESLGLSVRSAVARNPDQAAEYQRLSRRFRVPPTAIEQDPIALQQHAKALDTISAAANTFALSRNIATKPGFADVSHDDVGALASIENFVTAVPKRIKSAFLGGSAAVVGAAEAFAEGPTSRAFKEKYGREAPLNKFLREYRQGIEGSANTARGERHPNWYAEQFLQGVESVPTSVMAAGMAMLGSPAAGLGFMGTTTAGGSYTKATDQGVDPGTAKLYALSQGVIEAGTEAIPVAKFLGDVKAGSGFFKTLAHNLAAEIPGEQAATVLQDLNDWAVLPENKDRNFGDYLTDRPEAALGTLIATFSGTTGNIALARAAEKTVRVTGRVLGGAARREDAAQQAQQVHEQLQQLGQLAVASKLRERDPQSFHDFVAEAAEGTPIEDVYVAPDQLGEVLNQGGLEPEQQQAVAEALGPRIAEAVQQGTDVRIPTAEFATLLAGTPAEKTLLDHLKTDPSGMTRAEAEEYMQTQGEQLQRDVEQAVQRATADDQQREQFDAVKSSIAEQLNTARRFTPAVNDAYANMMASAYATMAERAGITAQELWSRMPVRIQAQGVTGEKLDQRVDQTATPEFQSWFGDSKVRDEAGKPLVVYHGSGSEVAAFDTTKGTWFTDSKDLAGEYAAKEGGNVTPAFLNVRNPVEFVHAEQRKTIGEIISTALSAARDNPGADLANAKDIVDRLRASHGDEAKALFDFWRNDPDVAELFRALGFDGIKAFEKSDRKAATWAALDPTQIKSAIGNNGQFDPNDPNILHQRPAPSESWVAAVDSALADERTRGFGALGNASPALIEGGLPPGPVAIGLAKIHGIGRKHNVPAEVLHHLRNLLADPAAVFSSTDTAKPGAVVAVLDARDTDGNPIVAAIGPAGGRNVVFSVYGKSGRGAKSGDAVVQELLVAQQRKGHKVYVRNTSSGGYPSPIPGMSPTKDLSGSETQSAPTRQGQAILSLRPDVKKGSVSQESRGAYTPATDTITLLKSADLSTFLHESGHFFLEMLHRLATDPGAPQGITEDWKTTLKWFGVSEADWQGYTLEQKRASHEKWARGFEAYLYTGKAPSLKLQGIFGRFRSWLLRIYKSARDIGVQPSPAIRGVFDRMLASEQQIAEVEAAQSMLPMFESREASGMNPDQWREYQRQAQDASAEAVSDLEARSLRDMQWLDNAKGREVAKLRRKSAAIRKQVREEVAAEVMAEPVYRARLFLTKGLLDGEKTDGPHRLAIPEVDALYGDTPALKTIKDALGYGQYGMLSAENGVHPEQLAELFGFTSADHLIRDLMAAEPMKDKIDALTEKRLLEEHGDLNDEQAIDDAANKAIHNDARARFVATELAALDKATGKIRMLTQAAKVFARTTIDRVKIRDLRPALYESAAARAGRAAQAALAKGETTTAAAEKRNQLINIHSAKAAIQAREDVDKALEYFARLGKPGAVKSIDPEYLQQINTLLAAVDLRRGTTLRSIDSAQSLAEWIEKQRELGFEPIITDEVQQILSRKRSYKDMTVEELRGLSDAIKNIEHLGRLKNRLLTAKKDRDFGHAVDRAISAIRGNAVSTRETPIEPGTGVAAKAKKGVLDFLALHRKFASVIRQMDGFADGGDLWELFVRPMNAAGDREAGMRAEATKRLAEIMKPILGKGMQKKLYIPEINASLTLQGRLAVALNMGNAINRERVLAGDTWNQDQLEAVLSTLTAEQWGVVQSVWDYINSYWPQVAAKEQRVTGIVPEKVEAEPLTVTTADGQTLNLPGGYYPIKYDADRSSRAEADTAAEVAAQFTRGLYSRATTRRGHTKARVETVKRPVRKDLGVVVQHLSEVIHDLAWHEYLIDANRLLRAGGIDAAIRDHYGPETLRAMRNALTDMAAGELPAANVFERSVNYLRTGATVAGMGWSISTALLQPLGLSQSIKRIGARHVAKGLSRWLKDAASMENTVAWISAQSEFMRTRALTQQREINEIQNRVENKDSPLRDSFFYLIQKLQLVADVPTWIGQYEKSIEAGEEHERAVALADQAVLDAQGGGQIKDLAGIQRGGPLQKLWTNFYSFFSTTYNLMAESVGEARLNGSYGRLAVDTLLLTMIPATLGFLLRAGLKGDVPDDPEELAAKLAQENLSYLFGMMVGLRDLFQAASGMGEQPAGLVFLRDLKRFAEQVKQGEIDEALLKATNRLGGVVFHYPATQVQRTAQGFEAMAEGRTYNPVALLLGPPSEQ